MALTKYVACPLLPRVEASVANGDYDMSGDFCIEIRSVVRGYHVLVVVVEDSCDVEVEVAQRSWRSS